MNTGYFRNNPLLNTDSYKISHYLQYPNDTQFISSYIESRGGKWDKTVFFGMQMFIEQYMMQPFTMKDINEAENFLYEQLNFAGSCITITRVDEEEENE